MACAVCSKVQVMTIEMSGTNFKMWSQWLYYYPRSLCLAHDPAMSHTVLDAHTEPVGPARVSVLVALSSTTTT